MTSKEQDLSWLDVALYYMEQMAPKEPGAYFNDPEMQDEILIPDTDPEREARRADRVRKIFNPLYLTRANEEDLREIAWLIATWVWSTPKFRRQQFDDEILSQTLRAMPDHHADMSRSLTGLLAEQGAHPEFGLGPYGMTLTIPERERTVAHSLLLIPWLDFMQTDPTAKRVCMCRWCGIPFHATRSDATICSATCRSNRRHAQARAAQ